MAGVDLVLVDGAVVVAGYGEVREVNAYGRLPWMDNDCPQLLLFLSSHMWLV